MGDPHLPLAVEVPFEMALETTTDGTPPTAEGHGATVVRGRIDAVFADPDGGVTVVDWKTGELPTGRPASTLPCNSPSTGWPGRRCPGCRRNRVRPEHHIRPSEVRSGRTIEPDILYEREELAALLRSERGRGALRRTFRAVTIIGTCKGSRASAAIRIGPGRPACSTTSAPC